MESCINDIVPKEPDVKPQESNPKVNGLKPPVPSSKGKKDKPKRPDLQKERKKESKDKPKGVKQAKTSAPSGVKQAKTSAPSGVKQAKTSAPPSNGDKNAKGDAESKDSKKVSKQQGVELAKPKSKLIYYNGVIPDKTCISKDFPTVELVSVSDFRNPHATAEMYRDNLESFIITQVSGQIVDIGGNPIRHKRRNRLNVWSCCPLLCPRDHNRQYMRAKFDSKKKTLLYCNHRVEDCSCKTPDCYIAIDSIYYLSPETVLECVYKARAKVLYSAQHIYPSALGMSMDGQVSYRRIITDNSPGSATVTIAGNHTTFNNSTCDWMMNNHYFESDGRAMTWELVLETTQQYNVYRFVPCDLMDMDEPMVVDHFSPYATSYGSIDWRTISKQTLKGDVLDREVRPIQMYGLGTELGISSGSTLVSIPRTVIAEVKSKLGLAPRNMETLKLAERYTTSILNKVKNLQPEEAALCTLPVSLIAMYEPLATYNAQIAAAQVINEDEANMFNSLISQRTTTRERVFHYLKRTVSRYSWIQLIGFFLVLLLAVSHPYVRRLLKSLPGSLLTIMKRYIGVQTMSLETAVAPTISRERVGLPTDLIELGPPSFPPGTVMTRADSYQVFWPVIWSTAIVGPVFEELIKFFAPKTGFALFVIGEPLIKLLKGVTMRENQNACVLAIIFHGLTWLNARRGTLPSLFSNIIVHSIVNFLAVCMTYQNSLVMSMDRRAVLLGFLLKMIMRYLCRVNVSMSFLDSLFGKKMRVVRTHPIPPPIIKSCFWKEDGPTHHTALISQATPDQVCKPMLGAWPYGITMHEYHPFMCRGCQCNERRSVVSRQCLKRPEPATAVMDAYYVYSLSRHPSYYGPIKTIPPLSFNQWKSRFPLGRQQLLNEAKESLIYEPLNHKDYTYDCFVKQELQLDPNFIEPVSPTTMTLSAELLSELPISNGAIIDADPRNISGPSIRYKCVVSPTIAALEHHIATYTKKNKVNGYPCPFTLTKGFNPTQLGNWFSSLVDQFNTPYSVTDDGSRWDATMNYDLLQSELEVYEYFGARRKILNHMRKTAYRTKGITKNGIKFSIEATRKSGDPNTSLGNCIIDGQIHTFVYSLMYSLAGITPIMECYDEPVLCDFQIDNLSIDHQLPMHQYKFFMGVDGDDNITLVEGEEWQQVNQFMLTTYKVPAIRFAEIMLTALGIQPKLQVFEEFEHADYLSGYFYPIGFNRYVHGPKIYRPLIKSGWSVHQYNSLGIKDWVYTNSISSKIDWQHIPILRELAKANQRIAYGGRYDLNKSSTRYKKHVTIPEHPSLETYIFVSDVTGIPMESIHEIETDLSTINHTCAYSHPALDDYFQRVLSKRYVG